MTPADQREGGGMETDWLPAKCRRGVHNWLGTSRGEWDVCIDCGKNRRRLPMTNPQTLQEER